MKTNKTTLKTLLFLCLIASIGACKKEVFDTVPPAASTPPPTTGGPSGPSQCDTLNYTEHTKIIFDTKCANAGCHDGASGAPYDLRDLTVIQGAKSSITNVVFVTETMPKSGSPALTETEKTTLKAFLKKSTPININRFLNFLKKAARNLKIVLLLKTLVPR